MLKKVLLVATLMGILLLNVSSIPGQETALVYAKPALGHAWFYRYDQDFTAYAMGNASSGAGPIVAGEDAAIRCSNLGGVPGGAVAYGDPLQVLWYEQAIPIPTADGGTSYDRSFVVGDCGYGGSFSLWWVDFYFGRWENKSPSDPTYCHCSGVPSPGTCYSASFSSCTRADSFRRYNQDYRILITTYP